MAMPLEKTIMSEIGLGQHYNYYNGSGSCEYIRQEAARSLRAAIQKHHDEGGGIDAPNGYLISLVGQIARNDDGDPYVLTNTWIACSYVIAEHIHQANTTPNERAAGYNHIASYLRGRYLKTVAGR